MKTFRISQPGINVLSATPVQRHFDAEWDSLKAAIIAETTVTFLNANNTQDFDIAHGLGYTPAFFVLFKATGTDWVPLPYAGGIFFGLDARSVGSIFASTDATNLRITINGLAGGGDADYTFKYYIFFNQLD